MQVLEEVKQEHIDKNRGEPLISYYRLDLSDLNQVKGFAEEIKSQNHYLHALINNAGAVN